MLRELREQRGLSQIEVAKRAKLTNVYLSLLENGKKRNPSLTVLRALAKALNVPVASLMEAGGIRRMETIWTAHLPTFFKIQLAEASKGKRSYLEVGWHLGHYHPEIFELEEKGLADVTDEEFSHPTDTLRRLFASDEQPEAGLVDYIPAKRRGDFLRGLVYGARGGTIGTC